MSNTKDIVSLRDYLCLKIEKTEKNLNDKIEALKEATKLAKSIMDDRLEAMNEFRAALKDQGANFITRNEHNVLYEKLYSTIETIKEDIHNLEETRAELRGKASQSQTNLALIISISGIIISAIGILTKII